MRHGTCESNGTIDKPDLFREGAGMLFIRRYQKYSNQPKEHRSYENQHGIEEIFLHYAPKLRKIGKKEFRVFIELHCSLISCEKYGNCMKIRVNCEVTEISRITVLLVPHRALQMSLTCATLNEKRMVVEVRFRGHGIAKDCEEHSNWARAFGMLGVQP